MNLMKMKHYGGKAAWLACMVLFHPLSVPAAEFHVSPGGSDVNPGTASNPLATLARARDAARTTTGPDTIAMAEGRYVHTGPIEFDERDSGLTVRGTNHGAVANYMAVCRSPGGKNGKTASGAHRFPRESGYST